MRVCVCVWVQPPEVTILRLKGGRRGRGEAAASPPPSLRRRFELEKREAEQSASSHHPRRVLSRDSTQLSGLYVVPLPTFQCEIGISFDSYVLYSNYITIKFI